MKITNCILICAQDTIFKHSESDIRYDYYISENISNVKSMTTIPGLPYKTAKGKATRVVARVKAEAIEGLYDQLETVEGQQYIYRIAAARDQSGKDICQIRIVKSATGEGLMKDDESKKRWGQYFNILMNKENQRVETEERDPNQASTRNISEEEPETALKVMKCGKAVGADEIPAEAWKYLGKF